MTDSTKGTMNRPTPSKKLSAKAIIGNVKSAIKAMGGKADVLDDEGNVKEAAQFVEVFRATGSIKAIKVGNSTYGEWVAYVGEIFGINCVDGEVFKGVELFLPAEADIVLRDPITKAVKDGQTVDLAIAIEAKLARTAVGYMYRCRPLMALDQPESRAATLLAQFAPKLALAAPAPAADPAPAPAPAEDPAPAATGKKAK